MTETRFWLIRHALVDENSRAILYGVTPLSRTRRTAQAIFNAGYPAEDLGVEPDLIEQSLGDWQGLPHADLPAKLAAPQHPFWPLAGDEKPPGGESMVEVIVRTGAALERIARDHAGEDVVVVSHGGTIRAAVAYALDVHPDNALHLSIHNLSLTGLERHPEGWRVTRVNELPGY
jgi:alpha-ribazole phosphatase